MTILRDRLKAFDKVQFSFKILSQQEREEFLLKFKKKGKGKAEFSN